MDISPKQALEISKHIKEKKRSQTKSSLAKESKQPIKHPSKKKPHHFVKTWAKNTPPLSDQDRLKSIEQQIESTSQLPASSRYAQHRLKVLHKAKELLQQTHSARTEDERKELEQLLAMLSL